MIISPRPAQIALTYSNPEQLRRVNRRMWIENDKETIGEYSTQLEKPWLPELKPFSQRTTNKEQQTSLEPHSS